jgi:hypothetical protein
MSARLSDHEPDCANPKGYRCANGVARCRVGVRIFELDPKSAHYRTDPSTLMVLRAEDQALVDRAIANATTRSAR